MAAMRPNQRLQVGSAAWIAQERKTALEIVESEAEEFTFSARNEIEWLNEHMAEIFSQNQVNVANIFKTPGKLRGKTPRTAKKSNPLEVRAPLSDVFSATQQGAPSPFRQARFERPAPSFRVAEDEPAQPVEESAQAHRPSSSSTVNNDNPFQRKNVVHNFDSGFFGSQPEEATQPFTQPVEVPTYRSTPPRPTSPMVDAAPLEMEDEQTLEIDDEVETVPTENTTVERRESEARRTTGGSFQSAHEDQSTAEEVLAEPETAVEPEMEAEPQAELEAELEVEVEAESEPEAEPEVEPELEGEDTRSPEQEADHVMEDVAYPNLDSPLRNQSPAVQSLREKTPQKSTTPSPKKHRSPLKELPVEPQPSELPQDEDENMDDAPVAASPSEGSSPIRPIVRKSSLNFASLPAREPLTTKKSIGNRTSRTSHLDQNRTSYYGRLTGGKSLGNVKLDNAEGSDDDMDIDDVEKLTTQEDSEAETKLTRMHNKTSTQRLQDQISMLGQTQAITRPASKSLAGSGLGASQSTQATQPPTPQKAAEPSPLQNNSTFVAPGAFPVDEEDSWIGPPPTTVTKDLSVFSPRPTIHKTYTTDIMENIHDKDTIGGSEFNMPKRGEEGRQRSPAREPAATGHTKSVSTSFIQSASPKKAGDIFSPPKPIAVSNPNPAVSTIDEELSSPPKSPPRILRGSPLKAAKDKFSSILKSSRGLFASSAAVSAEAKTETLSPPSARVYRNPTPSLEDVLRSESNDDDEPLQAADTRSIDTYQSASKTNIRKTRASTEREEKKKEEAAREAREAKEAKEAQKMTAQLEKARMKVKEEARVFHEEQERATALQKQMEARKEQEKLAKSSQVDVPRATRSSPRKTKAQLEAEAIAAATQPVEASSSKDVDMTDVSSSMPPPAIPRPKSQIGRPGAKRPLRPTKETVSKAKPPTVIRVDTGSSRGQQYHPSNTTLAATLQESLQAPTASTSSQQSHMRNKASTSSLQSKTSTNSFKAAANKALEAAARKKEQDELAAQRKREAKLEIERQRTAAKEEERRQQEVARKRELERQRELQKDATTTTEVKRAASRQAMDKRRLDMERAKETRAPPPAIRPQQNVDSWQDKALPPVPPQRNDLGGQTKLSRINPPMNTAKAPPKRPLQQDNNDELNSQPAMQRNGMSYLNEAHHKRARTNEYLDDDDELVESHPKMTAPPIRQSSIRPKEMVTKSLFPSGYAHAPPPANLQRTTLMSQHQSKAGHPMDMAQVSKGPIPFASSAGQNGQPYKTPARPGTASHAAKSAKSVAKSSPRYENGENIDLPEILTDSEDEDEDEDKEKKKFSGLGWTDSPEIRKQLALQETIDPQEVFGRPGPLNMEEVFSKSKDRFHKFRARTSSANWSGSDRLTEDEVRKDLEGRDRVRRQGGWTYDSMV